METPDTLKLMNFPLTDSGNAERLEFLIGKDWKYVESIKKWLHYTGLRWEETSPEELTVSAFKAFREIVSAIDSLPKPSDKTERQHRENVTNWLEKSENGNRLQSAIKILQGILKADYNIFDSDRFKLNTPSGTLNLTTGELQPHNRKDFITKITYAYYREPDSDLWERTVAEILPSEDVRRFMQRFMGYCLTASTEEEKFIVACGPGGCGKGTFFESIAKALGDYAGVLPIDVLLSSGQYDNGNGPTPELAKLPGKRLVLSSESGKGRKLDEPKVKLLTGGDTISARRLHAEPFEFQPAFKLIFETNYMPTIADSLDDGIRRRMVTIPFTAKIKNRNNRLKTELASMDNLVACLHWLVTGQQEWQQNGLGEIPADAVEMAERYYADNDIFQQWLDERTEVSTGALGFTKAYKDFSDWLYAGGGVRRYNRNSFAEAMEKHGHHKERRTCGNVYPGVALRM